MEYACTIREDYLRFVHTYITKEAKTIFKYIKIWNIYAWSRKTKVISYLHLISMRCMELQRQMA